MYAQMIEKFLKNEGLSECILFGHSFGGSVGIKTALRKRITINKLILCSSAGIRNQQTLKMKFFSSIAYIARLNTKIPFIRDIYPNLRKFFYYYILRERDYIDYPQLTETFKKVMQEDLSDKLQKISSPTLLLWGADDLSTPLSHGRIMNDKIPKSKIEVFKNRGHDLPKSYPNDITPSILSFLKK
jgi:pimeloyl-ACP methyl ester carboxylesterase